MKTDQTPLLIKVMSLLGETNISERQLAREKGNVDVYGTWDQATNNLVINPVPHVVDTLIHELLHKLHPEYSEQTVCSLTGKLMKHMTDNELQAIYSMYLKRIDAI